MIRSFVAACLLAASLPAQDFDNIQAERVATGLRYADGMVWSRSGFLVFSDISRRKIYRLDPGKPPSPAAEGAEGVQGLSYDSENRLYLCEPLTRRVSRMDRKGKRETLAETYQGRKFNSPNDIVVRKDGQIYFTDPAFASAIDTRELDFNGIFHITPKGEIETVAKWQTRPNGVALSADGRMLFVSDSDRHAVVAFDLDRAGVATHARDAIRNIEGVPGGIRLDVNGDLYVGAQGLAIYSPDGHLRRRMLNGEIITNLAFGDADFETLYVSGRKAIYKLRLGLKGAVQY